MKRLLMAAVAASMLVAGCASDDDGTDTDTGAPTDGATTTATDAPDGASLAIAGFDFEDGVTVASGTTLTVVNEDDVPHTFTADDGSFDTGTIAGDSQTAVTIEGSGEIAFHCNVHPNMTGTITVTE